MSKKKKEPMGFVQKVLKFKQAGISGSPMPNRVVNDQDRIDINTTIKSVLQITDKQKREANNMIFFVMYDIESNKVRTQIVKYLLRKGCTRIQRSIFLADLSSTAFEEIKRDLAEVQSLYNNHDSILVVPISSDYLQAMRVIGQSIEIDIITHAKNTLFF